MTRAIAQATREIPIVTGTADLVASGFVKSLARPGGNVTGLSDGATDLAVKSVELLKSLVPGLRKVAIFHHREESFAEIGDFIESGARASGVGAIRVPMAPPAERILGTIPGLRAQGVQAAIYASGTTRALHAELARAAIRERLPMWTDIEAMVASGLLGSLSAAPDFEDPLAGVVDKVLRGVRPEDIPVRLPERFRLVVNRATANALGLKVPPEILLRADEVIG
jgi:putative ABC transport system substrate-binding protein